MFYKCFTIYHSLFCQQKVCLTAVGSVGPELTTVPRLWQFLSLRIIVGAGEGCRARSAQPGNLSIIHHSIYIEL